MVKLVRFLFIMKLYPDLAYLLKYFYLTLSFIWKERANL